jgi:hypothetical protein
MIAMSVRDERSRYGLPRIDIKIARGAMQPAGSDFDQFFL